jgi:predicted metal-dependent HD superfamily phosphohydrolase
VKAQRCTPSQFASARIYLSATFHERLEQRARENLTAARATLA